MTRIFSSIALLLTCTLGLAAQVPSSKHIYVVALENKSYERLVGSSNMPYLNGLIKKGTLATQFYANRHNSITDYFLLTSGVVPTTNNTTTSTYDVNNLVRRMMTLGLTYKVYAQSLPYTGYAGVSSGAYLKRHTALPYYTDMGNSTNEMKKLVSTDHLTSDTQNQSLPNFGFITPDRYHDLHDCPDGEAACEKMADGFLKSYVEPLLATPAFQPGGDGLLIIWSDEADLDGDGDDRCSATVSTGCGGRVVVAMVGPKVKVGFKSTATYHHEHLLKTILMAMGETSNFPGLSSKVNPMSGFFVSTTSAAGIVISSPTNGSTVGSPVHVVAKSSQAKITATKVYVDGVSRYSTSGTSVDTYISMTSGSHHITVKNWDSSGAITSSAVTFTVK
jgi:phosphatidylinositol-3-phosphatase